jgi:hypothetical protein
MAQTCRRWASSFASTSRVRTALLGLTLVLAARDAAGQGPEAIGRAAGVARVVWRATGGQVDSAGLFRAGAAPGKYRVIATSSDHAVADTGTISIAAPPAPAPTTLVSPPRPPTASAVPSPTPTAPGTGIPFGPYGAWEGDDFKANTSVFNLSIGAFTAANIIPRLREARATHHKVILAMTGGSHNQYKTAGVFDFSKWLAKMDTYDRDDIREAIAQGVADGTIIGNSVMDEPHNTVNQSSWGPKGTMTKTVVDSMCAYVKQMFPTLPVGVVHDHEVFQPNQSYHACEFLVDQYAARKGDVTQFRDEALAMARRDKMAIVFSLNVIDGGIQAERDGNWACSPSETEGRGSFKPNCRMTAQQVRDWGILLGSSGCALTMWRYDPEYMADPGNQASFREVAAKLATLPSRSCGRSASGM